MMNFPHDNRRETSPWVPLVGALAVAVLCILILPIFSSPLQRFDQYLSQTQSLFQKDPEIMSPEATTHILAYITSRPPQTLYDIFVVERGSDHGVVDGKKVFGDNHIILGEIIDTTATTSRFVAYSSPDNVMTGYHEASKTILQLHGRGNGGFEVSVPRELPIAVGDIITDQSRENYIVGQVKSIDSDERDPFKTIYIRVPVSFHNLRYVWIEK